MEISRRLNKVAKSFGVYAEGMNTVVELRRICDRLEELAAYCDEKEALATENKRRRLEGSVSVGHAGAAAVSDKNAEIARTHAEESEEARKDQEQQRADPSLPKTEPETIPAKDGDGVPLREGEVATATPEPPTDQDAAASSESPTDPSLDESVKNAG